VLFPARGAPLSAANPNQEQCQRDKFHPAQKSGTSRKMHVAKSTSHVANVRAIAPPSTGPIDAIIFRYRRYPRRFGRPSREPDAKKPGFRRLGCSAEDFPRTLSRGGMHTHFERSGGHYRGPGEVRQLSIRARTKNGNIEKAAAREQPPSFYPALVPTCRSSRIPPKRFLSRARERAVFEEFVALISASKH
jgi:hypothetical protein